MAKNNTLTDREKQIALLLTRRLKSEEIADQLGLTKYSVETHRKHIFQKLGAKKPCGFSNDSRQQTHYFQYRQAVDKRGGREEETAIAKEKV